MMKLQIPLTLYSWHEILRRVSPYINAFTA